MNHINLQNAEKALMITTFLTIIVAGYEVLCSCQNYQIGMNLLDMDREYLVNQLMKLAKQNGVDIDAEVLGIIVNKSIFRVVAKGGILQNQGEETKTAALVLNGICRAYYVDGDGNDITRGFSIPGTLCMDEGLFGYRESIVTWETLEETTLMFFDIQEMKKIIYENNQLKDVYIMLLENALRYKIYRENGFLVENATDRYIHFKKLYPMICETVKQHYVATYLGIAPESLSRIKKALKEE